MSDFLMGEWGGRYDLTRLLIGSEGTLGIITEVTLRLQKLPEASTVSSFPSLTDRNNDTFERPAVLLSYTKSSKFLQISDDQANHTAFVLFRWLCATSKISEMQLMLQ
jgi:hypothetical protein